MKGSLVKTAVLLGTVGIAALVVVLAAGTGNQPPSRRAAEPSSPDAKPAQGDPLISQRTRGAATAPLTIYELSDFQCPFCKRQALETFPEIEREYIATGKVRWIFLNLPITEIHPNAVPAAELAMCAAKVDKFWPIHDLLFTYQSKWSPLKDPAPFLISLVDSAGIPREDILPCLQSREMRALVQSEAEGAARSGVASTPTVYIEGVGLLRGAVPFPLYKQVLDSLLAEKAAP